MTEQRTESAEIRAVSFLAADAVALVAEADAFNTALYGHADATPMKPEEFEPPSGLFVVAYASGEPVGCGGYRLSPDHAEGAVVEFKRLYVRPAARRRGLARAILGELEDRARSVGYTKVVLDVGRKQGAAHTLYELVGYHRIPGFSIYRDKPGNRAYGKDL